jgi:hypothetical protein
VSDAIDAVALNPQPLPPGPDDFRGGLLDSDAVALNPQPLPPGPDHAFDSHGFDAVHDVVHFDLLDTHDVAGF